MITKVCTCSISCVDVNRKDLIDFCEGLPVSVHQFEDGSLDVVIDDVNPYIFQTIYPLVCQFIEKSQIR